MLTQLVAELKEEEAIALAESRLAAGDDPREILEDGRKALDVVGKRFEAGEYFIPDLVFGGEIMAAIADVVRPKLTSEGPAETVGAIVIGTVENDIHDIGKDIVSFLLEINGFEVTDLGVNVPAEDFLRTIEEKQPDIVGISGLLTSVFDDIRLTVSAIEEAGLREGRRIIIGGGQMDAEVRAYTGADAFATDAGVGVEQCLSWVRGE